MIIGIKGKGSAPDLLSVGLKDVLKCIQDPEQNAWALLWLTAVGNLSPESVLSLEQNVNESPQGIVVSWPYLTDLADRLEQVIDIVLIGNRDAQHLHRYADDAEMYAACEYILELVDSSYWLLHSKDKEFMARAKDKLGEVESV